MTVFDVLRYPIDSNKDIIYIMNEIPYEILRIWYVKDLRGNKKNPSVDTIQLRFLVEKGVISSNSLIGRKMLLDKLKHRIMEYDSIDEIG